MDTDTASRRPELKVLHEDEALKVKMSGDPGDPNVFLCFSGIGGGRGGVQVEEFVGSTRLPGYSAIYITDRLRSWFNQPPELLLSVIGPLVKNKRVVTIGNSMGGFGAIWMARVLDNVQTCLAFDPQYSVHPEIVPEERRWWPQRRLIQDWRVPSLLNSFVPRTRFWTFNGGADEEHWRRFPPGENMTHLLVDDSGHDVAKVLKEAGVLSEVIRDCVDGVDPMDRIAAAGVRVTRITPETTRPGQRKRGQGGEAAPDRAARRERRQRRQAERSAGGAHRPGKTSEKPT